jgi:hypothetical protein
MRKLLLCIAGLLPLCLFAQSPVVAGEWFIGEDPKFGNATPFSYEGEEITISIPESALPTPGLHSFHVRVIDEAGAWSHTYDRMFAVVYRDTVHELATLEWFWDEDPGFGAANAVAASGDTATIAFPVTVDGLGPGFHSLYVRLLADDGIWGQTYQRATLVRSDPDFLIDNLVYRYTRPGEAPISFTYSLDSPAHYVDVSFQPDTTGLVDGQEYDFCISAVRTDGKESCSTCRNFTFRDLTNSLGTPTTLPLTIFPNPNRGTFTIDLPDALPTRGIFQLFDPLGKSVHRQLLPPGTHGRVNVAVQTLPAGTYFGVVEIDGRVRVQRVVVNP